MCREWLWTRGDRGKTTLHAISLGLVLLTVLLFFFDLHILFSGRVANEMCAIIFKVYLGTPRLAIMVFIPRLHNELDSLG